MSGAEVALAESRIKKLYQDMSITSSDRSTYLRLAKWIGGNARVTTWMLSKETGMRTSDLRYELRRMESKGLVVAASNGSNSITWSLAP